jgi:hypothetical protein
VLNLSLHDNNETKKKNVLVELPKEDLDDFIRKLEVVSEVSRVAIAFSYGEGCSRTEGVIFFDLPSIHARITILTSFLCVLIPAISKQRVLSGNLIFQTVILDFPLFSGEIFALVPTLEKYSFHCKRISLGFQVA